MTLGLAMNFYIQYQRHNLYRKKGKLYFFKMKIFGSSSDTLKRMKRQYTDWEVIFASHVSDE